MTSDQGQAARPALGYRPPPHALRTPHAEAPVVETAPAPSRTDSDLTAAAWLIGHGIPEFEWERDERLAKEKGKERSRLARLRLYSYCMTLSACVLALMAFMYLLTGTADGDAGFTSVGVMFLGMMILMLWGALRVTRAGEEALSAPPV